MKRKIKWKNVIIALVVLQLVAGTIRLAIESHIDPERHEYCVIHEIC